MSLRADMLLCDGVQLLDAAAPFDVRSARFVEDGKCVTSAGISAGLDASLAPLRRLCGAEVATATAAWLEYDAKAWSVHA